MSDFIDRLLSTRAGYAEEQKLHKFYLDTYAGTGGYAGRVPSSTSSFWGSGAALYDSDDTYLTKFRREDGQKFSARIELAVYPTHAATGIDIPLSYLRRKPFQRRVNGAIGDWLNFDFGGATWDEILFGTIDLRASVLGWCPVLFDIPPVDGDQSMAQAFESGAIPTPIPLFPSNILDYEVDRFGRLVWCNTSVDFTRDRTPFSRGLSGKRITVWTASEAQWWEVVSDGNKKSIVGEGEGLHGFSRVPIEIFAPRPRPGSNIEGLSLIAHTAQTAHAMYNRISELTEILRSCSFPILQMPLAPGQKPATVELSTSNAMPVSENASRDYKWIAPDSAIISTYQSEIEALRKEIYRQSRIEWTEQKGATTKSGVAHAYEFETANRAIADFAKSLSKFDLRCLQLVGETFPNVEVENLHVAASDKFAVQEMVRTLEEAMMALDVGLGKTATVEIKRNVARQILPHVEADTMGIIDAEIEDAAEGVGLQAQELARFLDDESGAQEAGED